jgi:hypothetical protein
MRRPLARTSPSTSLSESSQGGALASSLFCVRASRFRLAKRLAGSLRAYQPVPISKRTEKRHLVMRPQQGDWWQAARRIKVVQVRPNGRRALKASATNRTSDDLRPRAGLAWRKPGRLPLQTTRDRSASYDDRNGSFSSEKPCASVLLPGPFAVPSRAVERVRFSQSQCARLVEVLAHVCACGVRGEEPEAKGSRRFQPQNLGKAVRDAVGEMCPDSSPATHEEPATAGSTFAGLATREPTLHPSLHPLHSGKYSF